MSAWSDESLVGWTPNAGDVVVATAGKSGTTWMQQIITQLLAGGSEAALNDFGSLHELSPWVSFRVSSPAVLAARSPEFARAWLATRLRSRIRADDLQLLETVAHSKES